MTQTLERFYFTFGIGHDLADYYQLINAPNEIEAQKAMFETHGKNWAFPYDEEAWNKRVKSRMYRPLKALEPITVEPLKEVSEV